jgi:hypothetical protein
MAGEGWANSPWVFWHYDLGNQLHVQMCRALRGSAPSAAWYGYIEPPPEPPDAVRHGHPSFAPAASQR